MPGQSDLIYNVFPKKLSLYDILEIDSNASESKIKKAYFRLALRFHPDKNVGDESAKEKFQALSQVHAILSDSEKRAVYDSTGDILDDDFDTDEFDKWDDYWRQLFPRITIEDINNFKVKYQGSEEEKADIIEAYQKCNGNMQQVIDSVMLATEEDEERFCAIIQEYIDVGNAENLPGLENTRKKKKRRKSKKAQQEAKEAEEELARLILNRQNQNTQITKRQQEFDDMVADLEARYSKPNKAKGKKKSKKSVQPPDLDDAEFEALQRRMFGKK